MEALKDTVVRCYFIGFVVGNFCSSGALYLLSNLFNKIQNPEVSDTTEEAVSKARHCERSEAISKI